MGVTVGAMKKGMTPIEKLNFGLRWENIRHSYFQQQNNIFEADKLMTKIKGIEAEISITNYQNQGSNESAYK